MIPASVHADGGGSTAQASATSRTGSCPLCNGGSLSPVLHVAAVPVHQNLLPATAAEATACRRGSIDLTLCRACGFVFNAAFDETVVTYSPGYEPSQAHSTAFQTYLDELIRDLIARHDLPGRTVVEIGCGRGEFLSGLCAAARCRGVGFDPSYPGVPEVAGAVTILAEPYAAEHPRALADLICARHVIEHLPRPGELLQTLRRALGRRPAALFFETPRFEWIVEQGAFWDIFYEHCAYFAMPVLAALLWRSGFTVTRQAPAFGGQYQWLEARPGRERKTAGVDLDLSPWATAVQAFADAWREQRQLWRGEMRDLGDARVAIWGAGAKGVTFLNLLELGPDTVPVVVDINPRKQGRYVPGTGQRVVGPAALREQPVDRVIVMNPNYVGEVRELLDAMGLHPVVRPLTGVTPACPR